AWAARNAVVVVRTQKRARRSPLIFNVLFLPVLALGIWPSAALGFATVSSFAPPVLKTPASERFGKGGATCLLWPDSHGLCEESPRGFDYPLIIADSPPACQPLPARFSGNLARIVSPTGVNCLTRLPVCVILNQVGNFYHRAGDESG